MTQWAAQEIASVWSRIGTLNGLSTPSKRSSFGIGNHATDRVSVVVGGKHHVLLRFAFETALEYLHLNKHGHANPCVIDSNNDPGKAGPLCLASRAKLAGGYGPRNITYVLPVLQAVGLVIICSQKPNRVWLTTPPVCDTPPLLESSDSLPKEGLLTANQADFAYYLSTLWSGAKGSFSHQYKISKHRAWADWKALHGGNQWWCQTLSQANEHYSWPEKEAPGDFASIAADLRNAINAKNAENDLAALAACKAIFAWGGVARKADDASLLWVEAQAKAKTLSVSILRAVELLRPGSTQKLDAFDGKTLLMNSAMTKIYAAAKPDEVIIYDGRVGAALGLLARLWLSRLGANTVPGDLAFRWGPNTRTKTQPNETRNPSLGTLEFSNLYTGSSSHSARTQEWAECVRVSNRILEATCKILATRGQDVTLGMLERAFFMLGYDVR